MKTTDADDFYLKYITELIVRIQPNTLHTSIILTSIYNEPYQQHLHPMRTHFQKGMTGLPTRYRS